MRLLCFVNKSNLDNLYMKKKKYNKLFPKFIEYF